MSVTTTTFKNAKNEVNIKYGELLKVFTANNFKNGSIVNNAKPVKIPK